MRTIKFRGQSVMDGKWFHGDLINSDGFTNPRIRYLFDDAEFLEEEFMSETIGQFTGLHDDNDSEIYEGDIIHIAGRGFEEYDFGVVTWHENGYFFVDDSFGKHEKTNVNPIGDFFDRSKHDFNGIVITVNGNIHDNTELFKKEV